MTKLELYKSLISVDNSINSEKAMSILDTILNSIKRAIKEGRRAEFRKFGTFLPHERTGYETVNPATGKRITLKKRKLMRFRASDSLNKIINKSKTGDIIK